MFVNAFYLIRANDKEFLIDHYDAMRMLNPRGIALYEGGSTNPCVYPCPAPIPA
jgi:hypothetical protein